MHARKKAELRGEEVHERNWFPANWINCAHVLSRWVGKVAANSTLADEERTLGESTLLRSIGERG
jgi:hypothetical protein